MNKKKGFTMIELIAVMAIVSIVGLLINSLFLNANKSFEMVKDESYLQNEARIIFSTFESDIKMAKEFSNNMSVSGSSLIIKDKNGVEIPISPVDISPLGGGNITPIAYAKVVKETEGRLNNLEYVYLKRDGELIRAQAQTGTVDSIIIPTKSLNSIVMIPSSSNDREIKIQMELKSKKNYSEEFSTIITRRN